MCVLQDEATCGSEDSYPTLSSCIPSYFLMSSSSALRWLNRSPRSEVDARFAWQQAARLCSALPVRLRSFICTIRNDFKAGVRQRIARSECTATSVPEDARSLPDKVHQEPMQLGTRWHLLLTMPYHAYFACSDPPRSMHFCADLFCVHFRKLLHL